MEKVWDELKKIEAQAGQIHSEAQDKAKEIIAMAHKEAEELVANSKTYAQEEAQKLYTDTIARANRQRDEKLKANQQAAKQLKVQAEKRMEQASQQIVDAVLGEKKPWLRQHTMPLS